MSRKKYISKNGEFKDSVDASGFIAFWCLVAMLLAVFADVIIP